MTNPDPKRAEAVAKAIEACDWSQPSIGNKAILQEAVTLLRATPPAAPGGSAVREALHALYEWYDRDGSVGGASMVFEEHRASLASDASPSGEPVAWQWRSRIKGGVWDAWEYGRHGAEVPPFMDVEERTLYTTPPAPNEPVPASGGVEAEEAILRAWDKCKPQWRNPVGMFPAYAYAVFREGYLAALSATDKETEGNG